MLILCIVTLTIPALAKNYRTKVLLNADFMERDNEKDITILRDNVQVIFQQNYISCNEAIVIWAKNEVIAVGDVLLRNMKADVEADKVVFNFETDKAQIYNGTISAGQMLIQSDYIDRHGEDKFIADDAYFTSCVTCPASWSFTASSVEAQIEGYAHIKNTWMRFLEFPTIYFPYLVVPLKNKRQTGLLAPTMQLQSERGLSFKLPFFWAISRSQDATIGLQYYTKSGLQLLTNYRYMLSNKSSGEFDYAIINDQHLETDPITQLQQFDIHKTNRWHMAYTHRFELPNNYVQRTNIYLASDLKYSEDYPNLFNFRGSPALDNRVSLTKYSEDYSLSLDASYYLSLIENSIDASKSSSVHRLPEIRLTLIDKKIFSDWPLFFSGEAQYVNLARQGLGYDSPTSVDANGDPVFTPTTNNGAFDPTTDQIRTGQRWDFQTEVYAPINFYDDKINITPFAKYRHTQYVLGALNESQQFEFFPHRNYLQVGGKASTTFTKVSKSRKYKHNFTPEVAFQAMPALFQEDHPFFGTQDQLPFFFETQPLQDQDLGTNGRGLQFDYEDRIVGRRIVNFSLLNKVIRKKKSTLGNRYDQMFFFRLSQAYDLKEARSDTDRPWQDIRALISLRSGNIESFTEAFHFPYHKVTNVNTRLRANLGANFAQIIYTNYLNVPRLPSSVDRDLRQESIHLSGGTSLPYLNVFGTLEYSLITQEFTQYTVNTEIIPPGDCWLIGTRFSQTLQTNDFNMNINIEFKFNK